MGFLSEKELYMLQVGKKLGEFIALTKIVDHTIDMKINPDHEVIEVWTEDAKRIATLDLTEPLDAISVQLRELHLTLWEKYENGMSFNVDWTNHHNPSTPGSRKQLR